MPPPSPRRARAPRARLSPLVLLSLLHAVLLAQQATSAAAKNVLRVNLGGAYLAPIGFRADIRELLTNPSATSPVSVPKDSLSLTGSWAPVYASYRYAFKGDLQLRVPLPDDTFDVALLFLESWSGAAKPGVRAFSLAVNGDLKISTLDVAKSIGFKKPLYIRYNNLRPVNGFVTVTLKRIPGKNNPMISGLIVYGPGADSKIGNRGFGGPTTPPSTTQSDSSSPSSPPSDAADPTCATGISALNKSTGKRACCPAVCGKCGGKGCGSFAKGTLCCISSISNTQKSCTITSPPCVIDANVAPTSKPTTAPPPQPAGCPADSILGYNKSSGKSACCESECGKCGGIGCGSFAPGKPCCISTIYASGKSCTSNNKPPCVPSTPTGGSGGSPTTSPPTTTAATTTAETKPVSGCKVSGATANSFRMNIAGKAISAASMGADNPSYIQSKSKGEDFGGSSSKKISAKSGPQPWDPAYASHRWTKASVLTYKIPLVSGKYTVNLLFAETYFSKSGEREFDIYINGIEKQKDVDVYKLAGKNVGLLLSFPNISPNGGGIAVTLIKGKENPMISGIMIEGPGAGSKAVGGGCSSDGSGDGDGDLNGGFNHRAHSVPGGPYVATDFDKNGKAFVSFDGTQSHSHYNDPGPPEVTGKIVSYKWTWTEIVDGQKKSKYNNYKSGKFTAPFPLGKTIVTLEVVDSTGDVASDTAVVEVKKSTSNGAYCYYYDFGEDIYSTVPLSVSLNSSPKPLFGAPTAKIEYKWASSFSKVPFSKNSFAVRCMFYIDVPKTGSYSYTVRHGGPFKLYHSGILFAQSNSKGDTSTPSKNLPQGLNSFQLHYFRPKNIASKLVLADSKGTPLTSSVLQHDSSATLPVITGLSKTSSTAAGGQNIQIFGSGFINGVSVSFGSIEASNLISSDAGTLQVTVPPGVGIVPVTVHTNAGVSNEIPFTYTSVETLNQPVVFKQTKLKDADGKDYKVSFIASATYGPDGRLYLGSTASKVYALSIGKGYKVEATCVKQIGTKRAVMGTAFSPFSNNLKLYFSTSTLYWKDKNLLSFEKGWPNGKIETVEFSKMSKSGSSCAYNQQEVITGLPVSNHDHGVNKLQFLPNGRLLIGVGGFTNGGVSVPGKKPVPGDEKDDLLGGVASNPLSAALVSCPVNKKVDIKYDNYADPEKAKVVAGGDCTVYASGFRNSFGMTLHTNGKLYAVDNGPNTGFGDFSTNCKGGELKSKNLPDKLFLVQKGKFHGHANLNRKECQNYPSSAVQPIVGNLKSSSNGIIEYRSNTFGGEIKGNLYISKFSVQNSGLVAQVKLGKGGGTQGLGFAPSFLGFSGLSLVEGPRGELVMPRVYQAEIVVAYPSYKAPSVTFLIGVHPKQGPSFGGTKVLISGHNFGSTPTATFGGTACSKVVVIDDDSFTCVTPKKPKNAKVKVVVTGSVGISPSYGSDFWYM